MALEQAAVRGTIKAASDGIPGEVDVVVIGSGGAGMMAALSAARSGARVLVVESEHQVGGTTAISGGAAWIPNHGFSRKHLKGTDDPEQARRYLLGEGRDQVLDHEIVDTFIRTAPLVARYVEEQTYLSWIPVLWPDYTSDIDGASVTRALFPGPFPPEVLGEDAAFVRPPKKSGMAKNPLPLWLLNKIQGVWLAGYAMAGAFLEACLRTGVDVRVDAPAVRLEAVGTGVHGVVVDVDGVETTVRATKGVVLASGGFESAPDITSTYLGAPFTAQVSPKGHEGIAVRMAKAVGADLSTMHEAWWMPAVQVPGETMDDQPISRLVQGERALPHSIMVNSTGQRFGNEALSYNHLGKIMRQADPDGSMPNATAWLVFDDSYWTKFGIFGNPPGSEVPDYVVRADTLEQLADACGIDPGGLVKAIDEFNPEARQGRDPLFDRGGTLFERFFGDYHPRLGKNSPDARFPAATAKARSGIARAVGPVLGPLAARAAKKHDPEKIRARVVPSLAKIMRPSLESPRSSTLGPIDTPPYYAVKVEASAIGTVGGPGTDAHGRVVDADGNVIPGLYAAGNAGGATTQGFYGGAGGTIALGLVFGYLAGQDAARR
jgi:succinate dehydrogenase/fumarate reductase flavoprotein subunit